MTAQTATEVAQVLGDVQDGEMFWRRADGSKGAYTGPLRDLGHGIPRPDHGPGIRRALFDLAFGYVSGFPARDIVAYVIRSSFREGPILDAVAEVQESPQDAAQAPQDGANGGDVGSGRGEGENGAPECPCAACDPGTSLGGMRFPSRMNACPDCGNKRCPKAADHAMWQCNDSNEVGQVARAPGEGEA